SSNLQTRESQTSEIESEAKPTSDKEETKKTVDVPGYLNLFIGKLEKYITVKDALIKIVSRNGKQKSQQEMS
ncbi:hypothetical protein, partial [Bacillus sp. JJ1764]|uniref:hypothetical protein n=1 Tax=Bacillus sp. JJ1764 TaxID=3122964 RepID=UPI002FFE1F5E